MTKLWNPLELSLLLPETLYGIHLNIRNTVYKKHEISNNSKPTHTTIEYIVVGVV